MKSEKLLKLKRFELQVSRFELGQVGRNGLPLPSVADAADTILTYFWHGMCIVFDVVAVVAAHVVVVVVVAAHVVVVVVVATAVSA